MRLFSLLALCACTAAISAADVAPVATPAPVSTPVAANAFATLRVIDAIQASTLWKAGFEALRKEESEAKLQLDQMQEQIKGNRSKLEVLNRGSDKFAQIYEETEVLKTRIELISKRKGGDLERRQMVLVRDVITQMRAHLAVFAKERRLGLVLQAPSSINDNELPQFMLQFNLPLAMYAESASDITADFIVFSNARAAATNAAAAPTTSAAKP